jgi:hypothetical protein
VKIPIQIVNLSLILAKIIILDRIKILIIRVSFAKTIILAQIIYSTS